MMHSTLVIESENVSKTFYTSNTFTILTHLSPIPSQYNTFVTVHENISIFQPLLREPQKSSPSFAATLLPRSCMLVDNLPGLVPV